MRNSALHPAPKPLDVAVLGAGMSGLACAGALAGGGHRVRVFDKARGPGGRMSTRRAAGWHFDHGAQYFTVRDERFRRRVDAWREDGVVARWDGAIAVLEDGTARLKDAATSSARGSGRSAPRGERPAGPPERFVGVPGMSAVCAHLAAGLDVVPRTRVASLERAAGRWRLAAADGGGLGLYDAVVVSAPAPQTAGLFADVAPALARRASAVEMTPCWAAMAAFAEPLATGFDAAFVHGSPLGWVARNSSKPGRPDGEAWVLHATPEWSVRHLGVDPEGAARRLLEAFRAASPCAVGAPSRLDAHRWRFALPEPLEDPCLFDAELRLAACGDWCGGPRVEGAFLSGRAAAGRLMALAPSRPSRRGSQTAGEPPAGDSG